MAETDKERVDRELMELLNELRVVLPGVQVLFAFLLLLPFQQAFVTLDGMQRTVYLVAFTATAAATALLIAPSSYHRLRFREGDKEPMLFTSNRLLIGGTALVALSIAAVVFLIFDVVVGEPLAGIVAALTTVWFAWFWYGIPLRRMLQDRGRNEARGSGARAQGPAARRLPDGEPRR